jgi:hypothetical protein
MRSQSAGTPEWALLEGIGKMRKILSASLVMILSGTSHAQDAAGGARKEDKAPPDQPGISEKLPVFTYQRDQVVLQPKGEWRRYNNL